MEIDRHMQAPRAMPYTLLYRMVLERCGNVEQAIALLDLMPRQTANNLMLADAGGNCAVVEIQPERITVRRGRPGAALISTNHQRGQDQQSPGMCWRYDRLQRESSQTFGTITLPGLRRMLQGVVQGDGGKMTIQSIIFEPANRVMYVAAGADAPARQYVRLSPFE